VELVAAAFILGQQSPQNQRGATVGVDIQVLEAMTGAAITVQALNTDRMMGAATDRGLIAGVQRP
jgi:hypothetical protein